LRGGINTYAYVYGNPLSYIDSLGLFSSTMHINITNEALGNPWWSPLPKEVANVDNWQGSQDPENSFWHAMRDGLSNQSAEDADALYNQYVEQNISACTMKGLAAALHAAQDSEAGGHQGFQSWSGGMPSLSHLIQDTFPSKASYKAAVQISKDILERYKQKCECSAQ